MEIYYGVLLFLFGTVMGSFLQVMVQDYLTVYRREGLSTKAELPALLKLTRQKGMLGRFTSRRSECPHCNKKLTAWELIPLFSFVAQRGRCKACGAAIPLSDFLVELATGLLFLVTYLAIGLDIMLAPLLALWSFALLIVLFDWVEMEIPNLFMWPYVALSFVLALLSGNVYEHLLAALVLGGALLALWILTRGQGIGFADWQLAFASGLVLGWQGITAVVVSFWVGAAYGVALIAVNRLQGKDTVGMKTAVPFGPFLVLGLVLTLLGGWNLFPYLI